MTTKICPVRDNFPKPLNFVIIFAWMFFISLKCHSKHYFQWTWYCFSVSNLGFCFFLSILCPVRDKLENEERNGLFGGKKTPKPSKMGENLMQKLS